MIFDELTFLSVPFDNSYRNVFSAIDTDGTFISNHRTPIFNFLTSNFPSYSMQMPNFKSVRRDEIYCSFNVQVPHTFDIELYNYIVTKNTIDGVLQFWFINRYLTENNANGVNLHLALELDVWNTYQYAIYTEPNEQLVEQTHIKQVFDDNGRIKPLNNLQVFDDQEPLTSYNEKGYNRHGNENFQWDILWVEVQISGKFKYVDINGSTSPLQRSTWNNKSESFIYASETFSSVFIPIAPFPKYTANFDFSEPIPRCVIVDKNGTPIETRGSVNFDNVTSDVVSARYTFRPPILYSIYRDAENNDIIVELENAIYAVDILNDAGQNIIKYGYVSDNEGLNVTYNDYFESEDLYSEFFAIGADYEDSGNFDVNKFVKTNPLCHRYPYERIYMQIGKGSDFEIVPKFYDEFYRIIQSPSCDGIRVLIEGGHGTNLYYNSKVIPILQNIDSSIPCSVSQYSDYVRNNGARLANAKEEELAGIQLSMEGAKANVAKGVVGAGTTFLSSALTGGITSAATGNPVSAVSGIVGGLLGAAGTAVNTAIDYDYAQLVSEEQTNLVEKRYSAIYKDLKNAKRMVTLSGGGENDTLVQDRILVRHEYLSTDNITYENLNVLYRLHLYGFRTNKFMDIRKFHMNSFVYLKTSGCRLSQGMNNVIKHKLEEILNNGVRCWRITSHNTGIIDMDYNCANYQNLEAN